MAAYDAAILLRPDYAVAYLNRGNIHLRRKAYDLAIADYDRAQAANPPLAAIPVLLTNRTNAFSETGRQTRALREADRAVSLDPDFAEAHLIRATALRRMGQYRAALASIDATLALDPTYGLAHLERGLTQCFAGDPDAARPAFVRGLEVAIYGRATKAGQSGHTVFTAQSRQLATDQIRARARATCFVSDRERALLAQNRTV